jgi:predicted Rossmann-fold nucleotide-binding protein
MFLYDYEIHGSVRFNRLTRDVETRGTPGWSPARVEDLLEPIVFRISFAEELRMGYEIRVSALAEGGRSILVVTVTDVSSHGFTATCVGSDGDLPDVVGFCFEAAGQTVAEMPDDRRLAKEHSLTDLHAVDSVLNHEAEFGHICVMASASVDARESTQKNIDEQANKVAVAEAAVAGAIDQGTRKRLELALKKARIRLERFQRLLRASAYWESALEFGRLWGHYSANEQKLALKGKYVPICTGGGPGIMRATAIGAREQGAQVIGIDAVFNNDENFKFSEPLKPVTGLDPRASHHSLASNVRLICNDFGIRELALINYANVILFWPGGFGTCWEVFETLSKIQTNHLRRWRTKAIFVHREFWQPLFDAIAHFREVGTINAYGDRIFIPGVDDNVEEFADNAYIAEVVDSPEEAFARTRTYIETLALENKLSRR